MSALVLTKLGYDVEILEQNESSLREEMGAGITVGPAAQEFFAKYDRVELPYAIPCPGVNYLDIKSKVTKFWKRPMLMSTWSSLYYRLRANLDGHKSSFCPNPPEPAQNQGKISIKIGAKVTNVSYADGKVTVGYTDTLNGGDCFVKSGLVIAADGASSTIRKVLLPEAERVYSGYLGWRGIVPEKDLSEESRNVLDPAFNSFVYPGGYICW